jgi:hypothetical protein
MEGRKSSADCRVWEEMRGLKVEESCSREIKRMNKIVMWRYWRVQKVL